MRQELAADMSNATAASGGMPAVDSEVVREKHQADMDLQKARLAKIDGEKRLVAIENQRLLQKSLEDQRQRARDQKQQARHEKQQARDEKQQVRDEYKRLRAELLTEKAAPERDELYIASLERDLTAARESRSRV